MMNWIFAFAASFCSSTVASLGLGGGSVLLLYLTLFAGTEQMKAQGINLLVFLPTACIALFFHAKNGLVQWKTVLRAGLFGLLGVGIGYFAAQYIGSELLSKIFAVFLLFIGGRELFGKK